MNINRLSKLELLSFLDSTLIAVVAVSIVVAHLVVPITLQSVYVGTLTFVSAVCAGAIFLLCVVQICALIIVFMKKYVFRFKALSIFLVSLAIFVACAFVSSFLIARSLQRPVGTDNLSFVFIAICLPLAYIFWREENQKSIFNLVALGEKVSTSYEFAVRFAIKVIANIIPPR
jgi:hypothetical protein